MKSFQAAATVLSSWSALRRATRIDFTSQGFLSEDIQMMLYRSRYLWTLHPQAAHSTVPRMPGIVHLHRQAVHKRRVLEKSASECVLHLADLSPHHCVDVTLFFLHNRLFTVENLMMCKFVKVRTEFRISMQSIDPTGVDALNLRRIIWGAWIQWPPITERWKVGNGAVQWWGRSVKWTKERWHYTMTSQHYIEKSWTPALLAAVLNSWSQ